MGSADKEASAAQIFDYGRDVGPTAVISRRDSALGTEVVSYEFDEV